MKKLIITLLIALGLIGFTGCVGGTSGGDDSKCESSGKCGDSATEKSVDEEGEGDKCGE